MKKSILVLSLAASMVLMSPLAHADLNSFLQSVNKQALSDINNFNNQLSKQFGIPVPNVDAIIKNVPNPADAFMVLQLSQMSHVEPAVVLQKYQRSKGRGWGELAHELGIKPGSPEFHALKNGNLTFSGMRSEGKNERDENGSEPPGHGHGNGRGRGHGRD
jgi:hypothetical protein